MNISTLILILLGASAGLVVIHALTSDNPGSDEPTLESLIKDVRSDNIDYYFNAICRKFSTAEDVKDCYIDLNVEWIREGCRATSLHEKMANWHEKQHLAMIDGLSEEGRHFLAYKLKFFIAMKEATLVAEERKGMVAAVLFGVLIGVLVIANRFNSKACDADLPLPVSHKRKPTSRPQISWFHESRTGNKIGALYRDRSVTTGVIVNSFIEHTRTPDAYCKDFTMDLGVKQEISRDEVGFEPRHDTEAHWSNV